MIVVVAAHDVDERVHAVDEMSADIADDEVSSRQRDPERVGAIHVARYRDGSAIGEGWRSAGEDALREYATS